MYNYSKNYNFNSNKDKIKDKIKKIKTNNSGITIVALVVTIIVLLILAGITIGTITGDNGIIDKAQEAKNDTNYAQWEEKIDQAIIDAESKHRNPEMSDVIEELINKGIISKNDRDSEELNKKGIITTVDGTRIEGKLDDYIEFGPGMIADKNETYNDGKDTAIIPAGFEILEEASTIKDGLVIQDKSGNQFVWIPVKTAVAEKEADGTNNKAMAIKSGNNYRGLLYDFTSGTPSTSTVQSGCTTTTSSYREPAYLIDSSRADGSSYNQDEDGNKIVTEDSLQQEYNKMIESVSKYHGFYVGRYELGLEGTRPVVKNASVNTNVTTADASNSNTYRWYGLYSKCKEFAPEESNKSVVSTMIWGSQYDAMLNWMQANGLNVSALADDTETIRNSSTTTGKQEKDFMKNVYDLYGCHYEWTLEAYVTSTRIVRGGNSRDSSAPSPRYYGTFSSSAISEASARLTLYIK